MIMNCRAGTPRRKTLISSRCCHVLKKKNCTGSTLVVCDVPCGPAPPPFPPPQHFVVRDIIPAALETGGSQHFLTGNSMTFLPALLDQLITVARILRIATLYFIIYTIYCTLYKSENPQALIFLHHSREVNISTTTLGHIVEVIGGPDLFN